MERLRSQNEQVDVIHRHLVADPLPHLVLANLPSSHRLAAEVDDTAKTSFAAERAESDRVLQEFLDVDIIVVGAPLYNFSVPASSRRESTASVSPARLSNTLRMAR